MTIALTTPVTGGAQTGFTSPTYTIVSDTSNPNPRAKQWAVTALGGTQAGVRVSSVSDPFVVAWTPPAGLKSIPQPNATTGRYPQIPYNVHRLDLKKGGNFAANQQPIPCWVECRIGIAAGVDSYDPANVRAMISLLQGALTQFAAGLGDTLVTGVP